MLNARGRSFTPFLRRCLFLGHDDMLAREPKRLFLRCDTCERQTLGWTIGPPPRAERLAPSRNATAYRQPRLRIVRPAL